MLLTGAGFKTRILRFVNLWKQCCHLHSVVDVLYPLVLFLLGAAHSHYTLNSTEKNQSTAITLFFFWGGGGGGGGEQDVGSSIVV